MANDARWYEAHRQEWIAETLRIFGFINRQHLQRKFGISIPQASKDLSRFMRENPEMMEYSLTGKKYLSKEKAQE